MKYLQNSIQLILLMALTYSASFDHWWVKPLQLPDQVTYPILSFLVFFFSLNLLVRFLKWLYRRGKKMPRKAKDNVTSGLGNLYYLILAGGIILSILGFFGIDYRTLFTSLSIVAAAIAIVSKEFIVEIISGIIISFSKDISLDDYVKVGEHTGKIIGINITKVALLTDDDDVIFIPNLKVFSSEVVNYTKREIKKVSIGFEMDIRALQTIEGLEQDLIKCLEEFHDQIEPDSYNLKIVDVKKDFLNLKFQYSLRRLNRELEREIRKKTVRQVVDFVKTHPAPPPAIPG
jgi:small-conductance mechanosensitive channel